MRSAEQVVVFLYITVILGVFVTRLGTETQEQRVFGPPGTGKTSYVARMVDAACERYGPDGVLLASYTRPAARELAARNSYLNRDRIATLHALCYRALGRPPLMVGGTLSEWNRRYPEYVVTTGLVGDIDDLSVDDFSYHTDGDQLLNAYQALRGQMVSPAQWPLPVRHFAHAWETFKEQEHRSDFTDLILRGLEELKTAPLAAVALFLDEVQDFSSLELLLARQWGHSMNLFVLAGDDDQCIYAFKGATPDAFLTPTVPPEQTMVLDQSYRVPRAIHRVASKWIERVARRHPKQYSPRQFEGEVAPCPLRWTVRYPNSLLSDLEKQTAEGKTVMVLASCSHFLDPLKRALLCAGIPFYNPYRLKRPDWNPLTRPVWRVPAIDRVFAFLKVSHKPGYRWTYADLECWTRPLKSQSLLAHGAKMQIAHAAETTPGETVGDADFDRWFINSEAACHAVQGNLQWFRRHSLATAREALEYPCSIAERHGVERFTNPKIILGTIHSVKGGEADIVYLLPDLSPKAARAWSSYDPDTYDSIVRCFYVALTRAREAVYWGQPSGPSVRPMYS
jgi:DNA helicase II / ATP-dependent DNA helicase PcrA